MKKRKKRPLKGPGSKQCRMFDVAMSSILFVLPIWGTAGWFFDRVEFSRLLQVMDPDDPPEHFIRNYDAG